MVMSIVADIINHLIRSRRRRGPNHARESIAVTIERNYLELNCDEK